MIPRKSVPLLFLILLLYLACTNLQLGQTASRFYDNMGGTLKAFPDAVVGSPSSFSFSAMGDTHMGTSGGSVFAQALALSKSDGDSFAVVAGDDSNTGQELEMTNFNTVAAAGGIPVYPAIGNHDIFFGGWNHYRTLIGRSIYSFNAGTVHFMFLDTANGTLGVEQINWLKDDLKRNANPLKVVVMHFPVYVSELSTVFKLSSDEETTLFMSLMNQFGVQLVISGHYHGGADHSFGGTRYLVTGAANNILDPGQHAHYVKVTVLNGQLNIRLVYIN